ncbi:MAG: metal-dependent transcriptional regulator [Oscillospiraceae bacterium]|jgi:DtxR family Mn-dependent transcriptional regulator
MERQACEGFYTVRGYQLLEQHGAHLTSSLEDYLEMIYRRMLLDGYVRVNALAEWLNVKPSSVSKMLGKLAQLGLVEYEKYGVISLTEQGKEIGKYLLWRHDTVRQFLSLLSGGTEQDSLTEAELLEHDFSRATMERLALLNEFLREQEEAFQEYVKRPKKP